MRIIDAKSSRSRRGARRRGVALVIVIVLIAISLPLFGVWAQSLMNEHRRLAQQQTRLQATRLAEAGLQRGVKLRAANVQYEGETWRVSAEALGGTQPATVRITIEPTENSQTLRCEATADYPQGAVRRARSTKRIDIPPAATDAAEATEDES